MGAFGPPGSTRYGLVNRLVSNPLSQLTRIPSHARKMQRISAHLLGIAYIRYVFRIEPVASMPIEDIIALSVPVVAHYLADCEPARGRVAGNRCPFGARSCRAGVDCVRRRTSEGVSLGRRAGMALKGGGVT